MSKITILYGDVAQRLERLTVDQEVPGSSPGIPILAVERTAFFL